MTSYYHHLKQLPQTSDQTNTFPINPPPIKTQSTSLFSPAYPIDIFACFSKDLSCLVLQQAFFRIVASSCLEFWWKENLSKGREGKLLEEYYERCGYDVRVEGVDSNGSGAIEETWGRGRR